jgi:hypothetical protein
MKPGVYDPDDPDGEFGIQNMPDSWISIERNRHDIEYNGWQLNVEIVKYLDGSIRCNAVKFLNPLHQNEFLESVDDESMRFDDYITEKYDKMVKYIESQLC